MPLDSKQQLQTEMSNMSEKDLATAVLGQSVARDLGKDQAVKTLQVLEAENLDPTSPDFNYPEFLDKVKAATLNDEDCELLNKMQIAPRLVQCGTPMFSDD